MLATKTRILFCALAVFSVFSAAPFLRADTEVTPSRAAQQTFKGYELYSWDDSGVWKFSLLIGTNRQKANREIQPSSPIVGIDALKRSLALLAPGETVFWLNGEEKDLKYPPKETVEDLKRFTKSLEIKLFTSE